MRAFFAAAVMATIIGVLVTTAAVAHEGWFVRVCPTKTEANRVYLAFSGGRQGFSWSWIKGRTRDETDLPRRFSSVPKLYIRGITVSMPGNIQPHAYVCIGFRDHIVHRMEFDDHSVRQRTGTILMIVPARATEEDTPSEPWQTIQPGRLGRPRG